MLRGIFGVFFYGGASMETMLLDCAIMIFWAKDKLIRMRKLLDDEQAPKHDINKLRKYIKGTEHDLSEIQICIEKIYNAWESERTFKAKRKQSGERLMLVK